MLDRKTIGLASFRSVNFSSRLWTTDVVWSHFVDGEARGHGADSRRPSYYSKRLQRSRFTSPFPEYRGELLGFVWRTGHGRQVRSHELGTSARIEQPSRPLRAGNSLPSSTRLFFSRLNGCEPFILGCCDVEAGFPSCRVWPNARGAVAARRSRGIETRWARKSASAGPAARSSGIHPMG